MKIFIRIYSGAQLDAHHRADNTLVAKVYSSLFITIHRTEQTARAAAAKLGGMVLEIEASALKSLVGELVGDEEISVNTVDGNNVGDDFTKGRSVGWVSISCEGIPYRKAYISNGVTVHEPTEGYVEYREFAPESEAYFDALTEEIGTTFAFV